MHTRPVWVEVSRGNLIANYLELLRVVRQSPSDQDAALLAVVKADAYGHGMRACADALAGAGAEWLGVTSVEEAAEARAVCPRSRILVMSGIWQGEADAVIEHRLTPLVWEDFHLDLLEAAAARRQLAAQSLGVHLELDTGMSRQGVPPDDGSLERILMRFTQESPLRLEGIATHFSAPEDLASNETGRQQSQLEAALAIVAAHGHRPGWLHAGNSATLLHGEQIAPLREAAGKLGARLMLRPGLALYGYAPRFTGAPVKPAATLRPVLAWKTRVASLRLVPAGATAGYNGTFRATGPTRLALLPLGYADGLSRSLSNRGSVLLRGRRAPIAGRISMDQTIVDVTGISGVAIGDEAVLLGAQGEAAITAYEHADLAGTIPYEVLCNISGRVPRVLVP